MSNKLDMHLIDALEQGYQIRFYPRWDGSLTLVKDKEEYLPESWERFYSWQNEFHRMMVGHALESVETNVEPENNQEYILYKRKEA